MDTLFRLVSFQQQQQQSDQSFNSTSRTSSSSRSSHNIQKNLPNYNLHQYTYNNQPGDHEEECFNFYMDEEDFSSSSSKHNYYPYQHHQPTFNNNTPTNTTTSTPSTPLQNHKYYGHLVDSFSNHSFSPVAAAHSSLDFDSSSSSSSSFSSSNWVTDLLLETARSIADKNKPRVQQLMWMLNELGSPYGDIDQKLASYFLQALFSRITDSGWSTYRTLSSASDKTCSFESTRKMVLKFQEVSPWTTFGHVASNGAIMEALDGEPNLHIIDISNTYCTQWPTLLEAIATRTDDPPHLRLTTVVTTKGGGGGSILGSVHKVMKEIGNRMEKFAKLMGVPFKFNIVHHAGDLCELNLANLDIREEEALAINCVGSLHTITPVANSRDYVISCFRKLQPRIITIVEEEADLDVGLEGLEFFRGFQECLRWFRVYLEALEESFPKTNNQRLMLERAAGRAVVDLVGCPEEESVERRETAGRWSRRMQGCGFVGVGYSEEVCDDVRALLRRYNNKEGCWSVRGWEGDGGGGIGMFLCWKEQPVVWASAWRPSS